MVFLFGSSSLLREGTGLDGIRKAYPHAYLFGCSTAGEICGSHAFEDSLVATAVRFEHATIAATRVSFDDAGDSYRAGQKLSEGFDPEGLRHVFVLSDGISVNGSELARGLTGSLPSHVTVTGGLSGDGDRFHKTFVLSEGAPESRAVAALGLYGERLRIGYGSMGGWEPFGPERLVTKSEGNVLYELDGKPSLQLYKKYLGEFARDLPASGLAFPLNVRTDENEPGVVRTILSISETEQSVVFAGDIPQGSRARLMKGSLPRLVEGAMGAARTTLETMGSCAPELAILISCVGRKLILRQRVEEETEGVRDILGEGTVMTGFYSYGELSPCGPGAPCALHNQTMTITAFSER